MNKIREYIEQQANCGQALFALLIDPEKCTHTLLERYLGAIQEAPPDFIFVGGSQGQNSAQHLVDALKSTKIPIVLFPGNHLQFTNHADALLFLSLISGRNPEFLISQHVKAAPSIAKTDVECIPTGYILIDGGNQCAVARASKTEPIPATNTQFIVDTALAGQLLGMQLIYLEAGSGAIQSVSPELVTELKQHIRIPIIVGGGIKLPQQAKQLVRAGATIIVIGNHLETHPEELPLFVNAITHP